MTRLLRKGDVNWRWARNLRNLIGQVHRKGKKIQIEPGTIDPDGRGRNFFLPRGKIIWLQELSQPLQFILVLEGVMLSIIPCFSRVVSLQLNEALRYCGGCCPCF